MPTSIPQKAGWWQTPSGFPLTPTGDPKKIAVDNPYITKDSYIETPEAIGLGINGSHILYTSGQLDKIILRASSWANRFCRRYFDTQTIDETITGFVVRPFNPSLVSVNLNNSPIAANPTSIYGINSIYIQVLQWFIQVNSTGPNSYLQVFPEYGFYKIVPMLNNAGSGTGVPIPAEILDRVPLGVLWTNYTFGFGQIITGETLSAITAGTIYQSDISNRLWAPDQTINVYVNGTLQNASAYSIDYPNGIVTFGSSIPTTAIVTADFTSNETTPYDLKEAVILYTSHLIGQAIHNPVGFNSMAIQTYNVTFGDKVVERAKEILSPYIRKPITII